MMNALKLFLIGILITCSFIPSAAFADTERCERLDVDKLSNVPSDIVKLDNMAIIEDYLDKTCHQYTSDTEKIGWAVDMAYILHTLSFLPEIHVSNVDYISSNELQKIENRVLKDLVSYRRYSKNTTSKANAYDLAAIQFMSCQKMHAFSYETCPAGLYESILKSYKKSTPENKTLYVETFIDGAIEMSKIHQASRAKVDKHLKSIKPKSN